MFWGQPCQIKLKLAHTMLLTKNVQAAKEKSKVHSLHRATHNYYSWKKKQLKLKLYFLVQYTCW